MAKEVIQIGNKIEMRAVMNRSLTTEDMGADVYVSQFLQWADSNVATIAIPSFKGHLIPLRVDDIYELQFVTRIGLYRCRGKVVKRNRTPNGLAVAEVKFISALEKFQRRQFYRMQCIIPMSYSILNQVQKELYQEKKRCLTLEQKLEIEKKLENQQLLFQKATVLDISGGGMRFNSSLQQEVGDILLLQPALPETVRKKIPFLFGRIIISRRIPNKEPVAYDNRIEFMEISSAEQEQIITYIFKEERDKRKRESDLNN